MHDNPKQLGFNQHFTIEYRIENNLWDFIRLGIGSNLESILIGYQVSCCIYQIINRIKPPWGSLS